MNFYITLASMFLCLCSFNNNVYCAEHDIDELTYALAARIGDKNIIDRYSLKDTIGTLKPSWEVNESYYVNIADVLSDMVYLVKDDFKKKKISKSDAEIILDYIDSIKCETVAEIQDRRMSSWLINEVFEESMALNYYNTLDD